MSSLSAYRPGRQGSGLGGSVLFERFIPRRWQFYGTNDCLLGWPFVLGRSGAAFAIKIESRASMSITDRDGCGYGYIDC